MASIVNHYIHSRMSSYHCYCLWVPLSNFLFVPFKVLFVSVQKKKILYIDLRLLFNKVKSFVNVIWLHINRHPHPHRLLQQHTKYSLSSSPSSSLLLLLFVCCCCWFSGWHCLNRAQIPTDYIIGKTYRIKLFIVFFFRFFSVWSECLGA